MVESEDISKAYTAIEKVFMPFSKEGIIFVYTRQTFHMYAVVADVTGPIIWMQENTL